MFSRFFRGRQDPAPPASGAASLRLLEMLLRQTTARRRYSLATAALRRAGFPVALVVAYRADEQNGLQVRALAGSAAVTDRPAFWETLGSRLSPLLGDEPGIPRWISLQDDPFRPGAAFLRRVDLACALALPLPADGLGEGEQAALLLASRVPLARHGPEVQEVLAAWSLYVAVAAPGGAVGGGGERGGPTGDWLLSGAWEASPAALTIVSGDEVAVANSAAEQLLHASVGNEGQIWPLWLAAAVRRLDEAGRDRESLLASRSRGVMLEVAIGGRVGARGGRTGRVIAVRDATAEVHADSRSAEAISTISHELRTPLTSMKNSVSLLLRGEAGTLPGQAQHFLEMTMRNIDRLNRLIGDLLDVSRAAAGRLDLHRQMVDLIPLMREALEIFAATAHQRRIALTCDCGLERYPAHVDGDKVVQMLHNTVGNALKFTPEGGRVRVWLNPRPGSGVPADARFVAERYFLPLRTFTLVVEDNGVGMSEEIRRTLFQPFARGREREQSEGGAAGSGLGLHITRTLVEAHGGSISVESRPGAGTTVWIMLPRDPESERVMVAMRRLRQLVANVPHGRLAFLDTRRPGETPEPGELRRASRLVREFTARLEAGGAGPAPVPVAVAGPFGAPSEPADGDGVEEPAPGLWVALVRDWPRLATAWEVERARPHAPALLERSVWELPDLASAGADGVLGAEATVADETAILETEDI